MIFHVDFWGNCNLTNPPESLPLRTLRVCTFLLLFLFSRSSGRFYVVVCVSACCVAHTRVSILFTSILVQTKKLWILNLTKTRTFASSTWLEKLYISVRPSRFTQGLLCDFFVSTFTVLLLFSFVFDVDFDTMDVNYQSMLIDN